MFVVAAFAALALCTPSAVRADPTNTSVRPGTPEGLQNEQEERQKEQKEFMREHSDPSGNIRPDAYRKGIEHVRHMKVAPYIGAKPLGEASPTVTK